MNSAYLKRNRIQVFAFGICCIAGVASVHADSVTVHCECRTTQNPSECKIAKREQFIKSEWTATRIPSNPGIAWTPDFIAEWCSRHSRPEDCQYTGKEF